MLNAISWQQYLTAVITLSAAWYIYIGLRYYGAELATKFKVTLPVRSITPPVAGKIAVVMGAAKPDEGTGLYPAEELLFSAVASDDISEQTLPKGPSDDLLDEAKALINAYADNDDKSEFLSLFKLLIDKYEIFSDEISLPAVIRSLSEFSAVKLPFEVKESEWPLTF
ncbi:MAG: hypothetical protein ABIX36_17095 [Mucilaginibacter sp.]|uniref:hypothetical protein n=1 Tax=Mucilaginibacter sp. TaxID=1882438 RepID=UPI0032662125